MPLAEEYRAQSPEIWQRHRCPRARAVTSEPCMTSECSMRRLNLNKAFTLIEPGPVRLVTTCDGRKSNVMTIFLDHGPRFGSSLSPQVHGITHLH